MKKYNVSFPNVSGIVVYGYKKDILVYFSNEAEMDEGQLKWIGRHCPLNIKSLEQLKKLSKCVISETPEDLSFDNFWSKYGRKINRKRCEPLWNKLSDSKRSLCLPSLDDYEGFLRRHPGRAKMDPENYLRNECWTNNYASL